jgi:hypothetical protein
LVKKSWNKWNEVVFEPNLHIPGEYANEVIEIKGYPKSGTTWLEYILFGILKTYCYPQRCVAEQEKGKFFRSMSAYLPHKKKTIHILVNPRTASTKHGNVRGWYWKTSNYRYVVIIRDPRANIVSYMYWSNQRNVDDIHMLNKHIGYMQDLWEDMYRNTSHRDRTFFIQYEYALTQTEALVRALSKWVGVPLRKFEDIQKAIRAFSAKEMRRLEAQGALSGENHLTHRQRQNLVRGSIDHEHLVNMPVKVRSASVDAWLKDDIRVTNEDRERWKRALWASKSYPRILRDSYVGDPMRGVFSSYARNNTFVDLQVSFCP